MPTSATTSLRAGGPSRGDRSRRPSARRGASRRRARRSSATRTRHAGWALPLNALGADRTVAWALGLLELSLGNAARAHEQLGPLVESRRAAGVGEPGDMRFVTDEIEALIGIGRLDDAEAMLAWYEGLAQASGRVFALAACERCRGPAPGGTRRARRGAYRARGLASPLRDDRRPVRPGPDVAGARVPSSAGRSTGSRPASRSRRHSGCSRAWGRDCGRSGPGPSSRGSAAAMPRATS